MKFNRGYKEVRDRVSKGSKYTMSCYNCDYFYQDFNDKEEVCQNPNVLKYFIKNTAVVLVFPSPKM